MKKILIIIIAAAVALMSYAQVELKFWHALNESGNGKFAEEGIKKFEELNPDIKITVVDIVKTDYTEAKLNEGQAKGDMPDLLWWGPQATGTLAKRGMIAKAGGFISEDKEFDKDDIYDGLWDVSKYKGEIWSVPFDANNLALYYNKKMFETEGIDPQTIKSWDDFLNAAIKLTKDKNGDGIIDQYGFEVPYGDSEWTVWTWQTLLWQAGGEFLGGREGNEVQFNSAAGIKALQFWVDMLYKYKCAFKSDKNFGSNTDPFMAEKAAMMINGPWNNNMIKGQNKVNVGVMFLPADQRRGTNIGGENLYIMKSTPEKEKAAWKFAKYIMSADFQVPWAVKTGFLPVCKSANDNHIYKEFLEENNFIKVYVEQMKYGKARPSIPEYPDISSYLGTELYKALGKETDTITALENSGDYAEKMLKSK